MCLTEMGSLFQMGGAGAGEPKLVQGEIANIHLTQIAAGEHHFVGVEQSEGRVYTWGGNSALYNRG